MKYLFIGLLALGCLDATAQTKKKKTQKPQTVSEASVPGRPSPEDMERNKRGLPTAQTDNKGPKPLHVVEQMPEASFNLEEYLGKNINYPDLAAKNNIQGRIIVQFIVEEDGSLSDITVVRGIGSGCDEEAIRVIKKMPKWKPGRQNGQPTRVYYTLPVTFKLTD